MPLSFDVLARKADGGYVHMSHGGLSHVLIDPEKLNTGVGHKLLLYIIITVSLSIHVILDT